MASRGEGSFSTYERSRNLIYVSSQVANDSTFPFKPGDKLVVTIDGERLIVEKQPTGRKKR